VDAYSLLRTFGALAVVLGMLAGALWIVRRHDIRLPGRVAGGATRRLEVVERVSLDSRRSVALLRRDGREHLVLLSPEGNIMLETAIIRDDIDLAAEAARREADQEAAVIAKAEAEAMRESFFAMVDKARDGVKGRVARVTGGRSAHESVEPDAQQEPLPEQAELASTADKSPPPPASVSEVAFSDPLPSPPEVAKPARTRAPRQKRTPATKRRTAGKTDE
jgi:flagellar biogenesis protein FliO